MAMLSLLVLCLSILGFAAWAAVSDWGMAGLNNNGPHGLSEMLYAFSSGTGNNGSAFAGLTGNTPWYNTTLGLAMLIGRFLMIVPDHGAGRFARAKEDRAAQRGHVPVSGGTFVVLLLGTVLLDRRAELSAGAGARPDRRALPDCTGENFFNIDIQTL